jgi:hypothetical protein
MNHYNISPETRKTTRRPYDQDRKSSKSFGPEAKGALKRITQEVPVAKPEKAKVSLRTKILAGGLALVAVVGSTDLVKKQIGNVVEKIPAAEPAYTESELDKMPHMTVARDEPGMYAEAIARESNPAVFDGDHPQEASDLIQHIQPELEHNNPTTVSVPILPEQQAANKKEG